MLFERTSYYPNAGAFEDVLNTRRAACDVRLSLGLPAGEIFVEKDSATGTQSVHWECQFHNDQDQKDDLSARALSAEFRDVRETMRGLVERFERRVYHSASAQSSVLRRVSLENQPIVPQEITFQSGDLTLTGFLYLPPGDGPFPCMITNHGSGINQGTTDQCRPGTAAVLMSWGIASFLPHRRGYGNSPGSPWREDVSADYGTEDYVRQLAQRLQDESDDVVAALEMLESRADIDSGHIGVMGSSFGGTVTLLAAAKCPRFRCAVEFAGAAMNWEKAPGLRKMMIEQAHKLTQPIYFMQAENDYSAAPTRDLAAALEGTDKVFQAKVYPGFGLTKDEGHFLYGYGNAVWGRDVRNFLDRWL